MTHMQITVEQLLEACKDQIAKGNGKKAIFLAGDEEGNYFHPMMFLFTEDVVENDWNGSIDNANNENMIILG